MSRRKSHASPGTYLAATFSLFKYVNSVEVTPAAATLSVPASSEGATADFSDLTSLGPGVYHLKETSPPLGFIGQSDYAIVTVTNDGDITVSSNGSFVIASNSSDVSSSTGVKTVTLEISNTRDVISKTIHKVWQTFSGSADTTIPSTPHSAIFKLTGTKSSTDNVIGYVTVTESTAGSPGSTWTLQNNLPTTNGEDWSLVSVSAAAQTASTAGSWDITVNNLPNGYDYSFAEVSDTNANASTIVIPDTNGATGIIGGYRATYTSSDSTFTNRKLINASVEKSWQKDGSALSPTPAGSIYVALMRTTVSPQPTDPASSDWSEVSGYGNIALTGNASDSSADWKATISDLDYADLSGNRYYYRFYELTGSAGTKIANNGFYDGVYTVGYGSYASQDSGTGAVTQTIVNNFETVAVQLTKEWPTTTANSIIINLESSTDSAFSSPAPTVVQQFTITKPTSTNPTFGNTNSSTMTLATGETATLTSGTITGGSTWVLSIPGLPKYAGGNALYYRFVEMKDTTTRAEDEQQVGDYLVDYKDVSSGIGKTALVDSVYTQTIQNKLARFQLSVEKAFSGGTDLSTSMTGQNVYIRLMRKVGDTPDGTFNTNNNNVVTLDGTLEAAPAEGKDCYEVSAWTGTWLNLERTNASGNYYTYYAVEVVPNGSGGYTDKSNGDSVAIGSNRVFTITNSGNYLVSSTTPPTGSATTLTVTNTLVNPMLDIHKQDDAATIPKALSGAAFTLKQTYIGNTAVSANQEDTYTWISSDTNASGNTGTWINAADSALSLAGLTDGTYILYESKAPAGYAMHSGQVTFTVTDGVLSVTNLSTIVQ